jgi:hypothetical protein
VCFAIFGAYSASFISVFCTESGDQFIYSLCPDFLLLYGLYVSGLAMGESNGSTPSDLPGPSRQSTGSSRHCLHCNKIFQAVHNGHRCCSADCTKARQALNRQSTKSSSAPVNKASKPAKRKKDTESPEKQTRME